MHSKKIAIREGALFRFFVCYHESLKKSFKINLKEGVTSHVRRIPRYSGFLWMALANTGIFLRGLQRCGKSRT